MKPKKVSKDEIFTEKELEILKEALDIYVKQECKKYDNLDTFDFSDNFKRNINKIFHECASADEIPQPETKILCQ